MAKYQIAELLDEAWVRWKYTRYEFEDDEKATAFAEDYYARIKDRKSIHRRPIVHLDKWIYKGPFSHNYWGAVWSQGMWKDNEVKNVQTEN